MYLFIKGEIWSTQTVYSYKHERYYDCHQYYIDKHKYPYKL